MNPNPVLEANGNGQPPRRRVIVCAGTGCMTGGPQQVFETFLQQLQAAELNITTEFKPEQPDDSLRLNRSGCQGFRQMGPLVTILPAFDVPPARCQ